MTKRNGDWTIVLREDQFQILRLLLERAIDEVNSTNKSWLPTRIAKIELVELSNRLMDIHG